MIQGFELPPRLQTARLTLDGHRLEDFEAFARMWADPDVVRHVGGRPSSEADSWNRLLRYRGLWPVLGYGYWAVRETGTGRFVGDLGFADFRREITPSIRGVPEAGWMFASWAHGLGLASEALAAALHWLDDAAAIPRSVCLIAPENRVSIRLAEKNAFRVEAHVRLMDNECLLLGRDGRAQVANSGKPSSEKG
jgi:RimJ/RimL family protein N-acetyltransferase